MLMWNVEAVIAFWMLLGLAMLLEERDSRSALAAGLGALIKVMPGLLAAVALRYRSMGRSLRYLVILLALIIAAYLPTALISPEFTGASLTAQWNKASWQTIYALIDGNFSTGNFGPLVERLDAGRAGVLLGNPSRLPAWVTLPAFGLLYLWLFTRPLRREPRAMVAWLGVTWCVFLLWSKGWSPQWTMYLLPLILLVFPGYQGVLAALALSLITLLEWPLLITRGMWWGLFITAPLRTLFIIALLVAFMRACRARPGEPAITWQMLLRREARHDA
jgi:hypothetical protein